MPQDGKTSNDGKITVMGLALSVALQSSSMIAMPDISQLAGSDIIMFSFVRVAAAHGFSWCNRERSEAITGPTRWLKTGLRPDQRSIVYYK